VRVNRPPLRKYIRKVGKPGQERIVVEVAEQKPKAISLESLKEKFGLSDSKIGGIIRDAEKFGKIKRVMNGSYVWSQD
jgi:predicted transcriptional regulator of viral defense system